MKNFSAIIKNSNKFDENVKLATTLILDLNKRQMREGNVGESTKAYGKFWFLTPKGKVLFKTSNDGSHGYVKYLNEIVCSKLAKNVGIDCAIYEPAILNNLEKTEGIASYNFAKENQKIISIAEFLGDEDSLKIDTTIYDIIPMLIEHGVGYNLDYYQILDGLYKMAIFDLLTFQSDRHLNNISLLIDSQKNIKLAPLYDNEYTFLEFSRPYFDLAYSKVDDFIDNFFYNDGMMNVNCYEKPLGKEGFDMYVDEIIEMAAGSEHHKKILKDILNKANIDAVFSDLKQKGTKINDGYENFVKTLFDYSKQKLISKYQIAFKEKIESNKNEDELCL